MEEYNAEVIEDSYDEVKLSYKEFILKSSLGMTPIASISIYSKVKAFKDKLVIEQTPKSYNKIPVVYTSDISDIQITNKISPFMIIVAIICMVIGFYGYYIAFLFAPLWLYLGFNKKITIYLRSGMSVVLYAGNKSDGTEFYEYICKLAHITS